MYDICTPVKRAWAVSYCSIYPGNWFEFFESSIAKFPPTGMVNGKIPNVGGFSINHEPKDRNPALVSRSGGFQN